MNDDTQPLYQLQLHFPTESWRDVLGWEDLYQISDTGKVRAKKSRVRGQYKAGDILKSRFSADGYETVILCLGQNRRTVFIHHLVMYAFIGARPAGHDINHRDGVKANNRLENLEYITHLANMRHSLDVLHVYRAKGERHGSARLNADQVRDIRRRRAQGEKRTDLAKEFKVSPEAIGAICARRRWKHID